MTDARLTPADYADAVGTDHPGVFAGAISGRPTVARDRGTDPTQPRPAVAELSPGDTIRLFGTPIRLTSVGKHVARGNTELYRLGVAVEPIGTVSTLWVDRDPYLLSVCNGPIYAVPPSEVDAE